MMRFNVTSCVAFGFMMATHAFAAERPISPIEATFAGSEKFSDLKDDYMDSEKGRDHLVGVLKEHFVVAAQRFLIAGQRLEIKVTDVDLAGEFEPWRGMRFADVRILREIYPPRIELEFRLLDSGGNVVTEGRRHLRDTSFLMGASMPSDNPLRHEKRMISDWLRQEFKRPG